MATEDTMESFISKQKETIQKKREETTAQIALLQVKLTEFDRELGAIDAYERALKGEPAKKKAGRGGGKRGKRQELLAKIKAEPNGMTRAEVIDAYGGKGNKTVEQMVSNSLSALKKSNMLTLTDGRYKAAS